MAMWIKPPRLGFATLAMAGGLAAVLAAGPASATITTALSPTFQQTSNAPCVIGNTSCKNGGLVDFEVSGTPGGMNGSTYTLFSPSYLVGAGVSPPDTIPTTFKIGVDENIAAGQSSEVLQFFDTYTCTSAVASGGSGSVPAGCTLNAANSFTGPFAIPNANNGNGFSDFVLTGFNLTGLTNVLFQASVSNDTDGMEQFFIIPQGTVPVPEPASLLLLGTALTFLGLVGRRRSA